MTYPEAHNLLTVHWQVAAVDEVGQFGLRFQSGAAPTQSDVTAAAAAVNTWWTAATAGVPPDYELTFCRAARIGVDGNYLPGTDSVEHVFSPPPIGGGASIGNLPLQLAFVYSLRTAKTKGLAYRGRIYAPYLSAVGLNTQHLIPIATATSAVNTMAQMLTTLSGGPMGTLRVYSFGNAGTPGGTSELVTHVGADNRMDVQRRRAAQQSGVAQTALGTVTV